MSRDPFEVVTGTSPIVLCFPHTGTFLPPEIDARLDANGRLLADTDWHVDRLYAGLLPAATTVRARFHRYVIDANRDPGGGSLYPGQNTTALVPLTDFDGRGIWREGAQPTDDDAAARLAAYHAPYHRALAGEIERVTAAHGVAVVFDCHSIRSEIPFLFEGTLPHFNVGTADGVTCDRAIQDAAVAVATAADGHSSVLNGRFKGGWTTRHYGRPERNVHAIQLELAQRAYLSSEAPPFAYDAAKSERLRGHLRAMLTRIETAAYGLAHRQEPT